MSKKRKSKSEPLPQPAGSATEENASEAGSNPHLSLVAADSNRTEDVPADSSDPSSPDDAAGEDVSTTDDASAEGASADGVARAAAELASRQVEFELPTDAMASPESADGEPNEPSEPTEPDRADQSCVEQPVEPSGEAELMETAGDATDEDAEEENGPVSEALGGELEEQVRQAGVQEEIRAEQVIEAILFAADTPLPLSKIVSILGVGSAREVRQHIEALNKKYAQIGTCFRVEKIANGYQMLTLPVYNNWLKRLRQSRQDSRLSPAAMETLAVVAYKQPVVRAEIEAIRGVSAGEMLNRLRELGMVKIVGRAEDVGRPMLYGTTKRFLEVFGLGGLEDLPTIEGMS